jgi:hypothetical protein
MSNCAHCFARVPSGTFHFCEYQVDKKALVIALEKVYNIAMAGLKYEKTIVEVPTVRA